MSKRKQAQNSVLTCRDMLNVMRKEHPSDAVSEMVREFLTMPEADRLFLTATLLLRLTLGDIARRVDETNVRESIETMIAIVEGDTATRQ